MNATSDIRIEPAPDLTSLGSVRLNDYYDRLYRYAQTMCWGTPAIKTRKLAEIHELMALAQISNRLAIDFVDLRDAMRVHFYMKTPVACLGDPASPLIIARQAEIGLVYPTEAFASPVPGYSFVTILNPGFCWHPNISFGGPSGVQALCLGAQLPAGTRLREIILMTYGALTMMTVQLDAFDAGGVLNCEAATWWTHNIDKLPLSREPFIKSFGENPAPSAMNK